jgi:glycosyltransferase involved in cell wall biosynthesis
MSEENKIPLVTIITVVLNDVNKIESTIISVVSQTYKNIEYIIIDGGSTDGTLEIIKRYENKISYFVSEPDNGIYDAMNKALMCSHGEYVWFLNSGDEIYDNFVLEKIFISVKEADLYYGKTLIFSEELNYKKELNIPDKLSLEHFKLGKMPVSHQSVIVKKSIVDLFDTTYKISSDFDWLIKVVKKARKMVVCDIIFTKYLIGGVSWKNYHKYRYDNLMIIKKYFSKKIYIINWVIFFIVVAKWNVEQLIKMLFPDFDFYLFKEKMLNKK